MKGKKQEEKPILETVKVEKKYVDLVREQKRKTYKPMAVFIGEAIVEKIEKENK